MKKSLIFCLLIMISLTLGCELTDDSEDPAAVATKGTIKVTVNYTGSGTVNATNKLYIAASTGSDWTTSLRIPSKITATVYGSDYLAESSSNNQELTLTIDPGTYYIVAAWDHDSSFTNQYIFNAGTQYVIYNGKYVPDTTNYTAITITAGEVVTLTMTIDGLHTI